MTKKAKSKTVIKQASMDTVKDSATLPRSTMKKLFGFEWRDLSNWENFVCLMNRPCDPSALGIWRIMFGFLMTSDLIQERGLSTADLRWGDKTDCRFPLFDFLKPLPVEWMYVVYLIGIAGAVGLMLGLFYRFSCLCLLIPYWYIFLLDKTSWNNHSYLFGLNMFLFTITDANRIWSIDSILFKRKSHAHVPLWNYAIIRTQFFVVYFIAGLKKLDMDWVSGYSMGDLSHHWTFEPFRYFLTNDQIDLYIVHGGGLVLDLTAGYLLFFDITRPVATLFITNFHVMNSQIFSIGMFPYTCIASTTIFYSFTWPKYLLGKLPIALQNIYLPESELQASSHCIYSKEYIKPDSKKKEENVQQIKNIKEAKSRPGLYHKFMSIVFILYVAEQIFLPYSHCLTKGYNNWTNGLYGYSWDMMVHSWRVQHIRITAVEKHNNNVMYLNPEAWTDSRRWSSHADMMKQYARCIEERLTTENITNISLYFDVYRSMNDRFQQRMFDPRVDILTAEWHPFKEVSWVFPLLVDLSNWRTKLVEIEEEIYNKSKDADVVFIADFPGLNLDQFIPADLGNTTLTLLNGEIIVEMNDQKKNVSVKAGDQIQVPAGEFHTVHTVSDVPSCYMYIYINTTEQELVKKIQEIGGHNNPDSNNLISSTNDDVLKEIPQLPDNVVDNLNKEDPKLAQMYQDIQQQRKLMESGVNTTLWDKAKNFAQIKYYTLYRSYEMSSLALKSIWTGRSFDDVVNGTVLRSDHLFVPHPEEE